MARQTMLFTDIRPSVKGAYHYDHLDHRNVPAGQSKRSYTHRFLCVTEGNCRITTADGACFADTGDIFYIRPGEVYNTVNESGTFSVLNVFFDYTDDRPQRETDTSIAQGEDYAAEAVQPAVCFADRPGLNRPFLLKGFPQGAHLLRRIAGEYQDRRLYYQKEADMLLMVFLVEMVRFLEEIHCAGRKSTKALVSRLLEYINTHVTDRLTNQELAAAFQYHPAYLNQLIKGATGQSLHRYVLEAKLQYADKLLAESCMSVTDIAQYLAFADGSHFTRVYAAKYGAPPSKSR